MQQALSKPEASVMLIGVLTLIGAGGWLLVRWIASGPATPDPWGEEIAATVDYDDCPQVCHRCLAEHDASAHLCPRCGAMVGMCTGLMPPLYLYCIGDVFRAGVDGTYRRPRWMVVGYYFAAIAYLRWFFFPLGLIFLIIYWRKLSQNRRKSASQ